MSQVFRLKGNYPYAVCNVRQRRGFEAAVQFAIHVAKEVITRAEAEMFVISLSSSTIYNSNQERSK